MAKSSSKQWVKEHISDPYVKTAKQLGFRSRAAFKLREINERDRILRRGMTALDLGAAPGGWSQLASRLVGPKGRVIAVDLLPMVPLAGVIFIQGDFREASVMQALRVALGESGVDVVLADVAPHISGVRATDQARVFDLAESAHACAGKLLRRGGDFLVKVFQGSGFDGYAKEVAGSFERVYVRKPKASRGRSSEVYMLARFFRL